MRPGRYRGVRQATRLFPLALGAGIIALSVLAAAPCWGQGVCCVDNVCNDLGDQVACIAASGEYHGDGTTCETVSCTSGVPLFRQYDPSTPPTILTDPPVRYICFDPYGDPDPVPMGTYLTFYRIEDQAAPVPPNPYELLMVTPQGFGGSLMWTGADCTQGSACCVADGVCHLVRDQAHCTSVYGGVYPGDGVDCASANCSMAVGACCESLDMCSDVPELSCPGQWMGELTDCSMYQCHGACCMADMSCIEAASEEECIAQGGGWGGDGTDCSMFQCQGACCLADNTCIHTPNAPECELQGGTFQGDGTDCAFTDCGAIPGACCDALGRCTDGTDDDCLLTGGVFQGPGTDCASVDCMDQPGACCTALNTCITEIPSMCPGEHRGLGTSCATIGCSGACCLPDESCFEAMGPVACEAMSGEWQGEGTDCLTAECNIPFGACCDISGGCTEVTEQQCIDAGSAFQGDETLCALVDCDARPGACCEAMGVCVEVLELACGGEFQGEGTNCLAIQCSGACCLMDGSCIETMAEGECLANLGAWQGDGSECITVDCTLPTGACCLPGAICVVETEPVCVSIPGVYQGNGTNCATTDCPL